MSQFFNFLYDLAGSDTAFYALLLLFGWLFVSWITGFLSRERISSSQTKNSKTSWLLDDEDSESFADQDFSDDHSTTQFAKPKPQKANDPMETEAPFPVRKQHGVFSVINSVLTMIGLVVGIAVGVVQLGQFAGWLPMSLAAQEVEVGKPETKPTFEPGVIPE